MRRLRAGLKVFTEWPEFNVLLFALLLNYPWEFIQVPLFEGMAESPHGAAVKACTQAALGDSVIMLIAYWGVAALRRDRTWIAAPVWRDVLLFSSIGVTITIVIEWLVQQGMWLSGWAYSSLMPIIPGLEVGLVPVLQWLVLPPLVVALVARQR